MRTPTPHLIPEMPPLRPCVDLAPSLRAKVLLKTLVGLILTAFKILVVLAATLVARGQCARFYDLVLHFTRTTAGSWRALIRNAMQA